MKLDLSQYKDLFIEEVKELAIYSRTYTIFELLDKISFKRCAESISILNRFVQEEGRDGILRLVGMLNRQIRLLWQTRSIIEQGGRFSDVMRKLGLKDFQSQLWSKDDLERAFQLLYQADGLVKSGSQEHLVLENVLLSLCA